MVQWCFGLASCRQWRPFDLILAFLKSLLNSSRIWEHYARTPFVNLGHRYMILRTNYLRICVRPGPYAYRSPTMFHSWQPMLRAAGILWLSRKINPPGCRKYSKDESLDHFFHCFVFNASFGPWLQTVSEWLPCHKFRFCVASIWRGFVETGPPKFRFSSDMCRHLATVLNIHVSELYIKFMFTVYAYFAWIHHAFVIFWGSSNWGTSKWPLAALLVASFRWELAYWRADFQIFFNLMHTFSASLTGLTVANLQNTYAISFLQSKNLKFASRFSCHFLKMGSISFVSPGTAFISTSHLFINEVNV